MQVDQQDEGNKSGGGNAANPDQPNPPVGENGGIEDGSHGRSSELTGNELQIAKYLTELMSHGVRTYATGFLLDQETMTLWYADRMGLVVSVPFNIFKSPSEAELGQ